jgi:hypothetical protein
MGDCSLFLFIFHFLLNLFDDRVFHFFVLGFSVGVVPWTGLFGFVIGITILSRPDSDWGYHREVGLLKVNLKLLSQSVFAEGFLPAHIFMTWVSLASDAISWSTIGYVVHTEVDIVRGCSGLDRDCWLWTTFSLSLDLLVLKVSRFITLISFSRLLLRLRLLILRIV